MAWGLAEVSEGPAPRRRRCRWAGSSVKAAQTRGGGGVAMKDVSGVEPAGQGGSGVGRRR
jgi:hypothetical protein